MSNTLVVLTNTYADGRTHPIVFNTTNIKEIVPDDREGVPSKAVVYTLNDRKYWVAEDIATVVQAIKDSNK